MCTLLVYKVGTQCLHVQREKKNTQPWKRVPFPSHLSKKGRSGLPAPAKASRSQSGEGQRQKQPSYPAGLGAPPSPPWVGLGHQWHIPFLVQGLDDTSASLSWDFSSAAPLSCAGLQQPRDRPSAAKLTQCSLGRRPLSQQERSRCPKWLIHHKWLNRGICEVHFHACQTHLN